MCFYSRMRNITAIPVRIEVQQKEDLDRICSELGLTTSAIIRMLVKSFQELYDRNNGKVEFPLKLKQ